MHDDHSTAVLARCPDRLARTESVGRHSSQPAGNIALRGKQSAATKKSSIEVGLAKALPACFLALFFSPAKSATIKWTRRMKSSLCFGKKTSRVPGLWGNGQPWCAFVSSRHSTLRKGDGLTASRNIGKSVKWRSESSLWKKSDKMSVFTAKSSRC